MRKLNVVFGVLILVCSIGMLAAQQDGVNETVNTAQQSRMVRTYSVKDLAVWSQNGTKFDPEILIALLESKVTPGQWDGENRIIPYAESVALVISTTPDAHQAITDILEEFRKK